MTIAKWLVSATKSLKDTGIDSGRIDSLVLLEFVLGKPKTSLLAHTDQELTISTSKKLESLLNKRLGRIPLAYLVMHKEFYGYDFYVNPDVLIPRPETEALVEFLIGAAPRHASCLDIGTGSGVIAISLKLERPDLTISGSDISKPALEVARKNAKRLGAEVRFIKSDLLTNVNKLFDIIATNLPYVKPGSDTSKEVDKEPSIAIYSGENGLSHLKELSLQIKKLDYKPKLVIEHDISQLGQVKKIFGSVGKFELISKFVSSFNFK